MNNEGLSSAEAYDKARKEFYALRHQEEVEHRVAKEEALSTGAYFGMSVLDIGMQLEDKEYERWKDWAAKNVQNMAERRAAGLARATSLDEMSEAEESEEEDDDLAEDLLSVPESMEEKGEV